MSYDWLMVAVGNPQPIVTNAGYADDSRKPRYRGRQNLPRPSF